MISYELAEELKDAGFPQEHKTGNTVGKTINDSVYIPTLSELIEACVDGEHEIRLYWSFKEKWCASQEGLTYPNGKFEMGVEIFDCETPQEAVARLYIALNKPN